MSQEYNRGYNECLAYAGKYNLQALRDMKDAIENQLKAGDIIENDYIKGVIFGIDVLKMKLVHEARQPIPKNSHIEKLINECNMLWKRSGV